MIEVGDVRLDPDEHRASVKGTDLVLPLKEFELLHLLLANAGRVLPRETLIDRVWGIDYVGDTKTLDVHVKRLRSKIERDPANPDADRHDPGPRLQVRTGLIRPDRVGESCKHVSRSLGPVGDADRVTRSPPPSRPPASKFRRLAITHALMMGGDAAMVVALADSLFFNIDLDAARSRVMLFLVISFAPFLVIAPLIGPLIDRVAGGRRLVIQLVAGSSSRPDDPDGELHRRAGAVPAGVRLAGVAEDLPGLEVGARAVDRAHP